jgi:CRISPR/Cas system-associated protein Cas10 (large subunit of type III CRISPR-Cas system)
MWATVWDCKRYALYLLDRYEEQIQVCKHAIEVLSKVSLFAYLESHNAIRSALRNMYNDMAIHILDTASTLDEVKVGLEYNKKSFTTISPIEDKKELLQFYETKAELLHKALQFDKSYEKQFDKSLADIKNKKLKEKDILSDEFIEKFGLI